MKRLYCLFLFCCLFLGVQAQSVRERICLDDSWQFAFGNASSSALDFGCGTEYFNYLTKAASIHNEGPYSSKFDASSWRTVDLPHDWVVDLPYAAEADYGFVDNYDEQHLMVYDKSIYLKDGEPRDKPYYHFLISKTDGKVVRPLPVSFDEIHAPVSLRRENGRMVSMLVSHLPAIVSNRGNWLLVETSSDTVYNYLTDGQRMEPFLLRKTTEDFDRMLGIGVMADRYWFMERVITKEMEQGSTTISFSDIFQVSNLVYDRREGRCYTSLVRNADFVRGEDDLVDLCAFPVNSGDVAAFLPMMAHRLVAAYEDGKLNDGPLKDLASRLDAEDNPVLMLMKYKK